MFRDILKFELGYHIKTVGFWLTFVILFLLGLATMSWDAINVGTVSGERIKANGSLTLAIQIGVFSLALLLFAAIFVVGGLLRDEQYKSVEIIHSRPVSSFNLSTTRMIAIFIATFLCLLGLQAGLIAGQLMPWMDKEALGPTNPIYYILPTILFTAINTLLIVSIFALIAAFTRNRALVYVSAVGLLILYLASSMFQNQDANETIAALSDPLGLAALGVDTENWPAYEQNTRLLPLTDLFGLNRLIWGGVSIVLFALGGVLFKRGIGGRSTKFAKIDNSGAGEFNVKPISPQTGFFADLAAFFARVKFEFLAVVKSIPFMVLTLIAIGLFVISIIAQMVTDISPTLPTSAKLSATVFGSLALPMIIIIVFFGSDISWRDRSARMNEIIDASIVKNSSLALAKWVAIIGVLLSLILTGILVGMIAQIILGDVPINFGTYFKTALFNIAPRFILFAALIMFLQNFLPNRITGMIVGGIVLIFLTIGVTLLPFYHPLMGYASVGAGGYSEINGFRSLISFKWFGLYWGLFALLFFVLTLWLWRRGSQTSLKHRMAKIKSTISKPSLAAGIISVFGILFTGGYIFKAYNIDNEYLTKKQAEKKQVEWEKLMWEYAKWELPKIRSLNLEIDLDTKTRSGNTKGSAIIENTTGKPLEKLFINLPTTEEGELKHISIEGAARITKGENIKEYEYYDYYLYEFSPALPVGGRTEMRFEIASKPPKLGKGSQILHNGTFFNSSAIVPSLGVADARMNNPDKRRKYGLPKKEKLPDRDDPKWRKINFFDPASDYIDTDIKFCTSKGQIPIAPGKMIREYKKDGKTCRDYKSERPIANFLSFLSADHEIKKDVWQGKNGQKVDLEIYYHKAHDYNVDLMMQAMKDSLDEFTEVFGPYQYSQLRIIEFPYGGFAQSFAGTIPFSENIGFVQDPGDAKDIKKMDTATYVTMHEIGHQWFGHQIMPAMTKGFNVLSEGITENAALLAYENVLGWKKTKRIIEDRFVNGYLMSRAMDNKSEPPLALAEEQSYLHYQKSGWVFWSLNQYLGEDKLQGAIKSFLQEYGQKGPPYPTTKQLVEHIRAVAPEEYQGLITDLWDRITLWKLSFEGEAEITENPDKTYTVKFTLKTDKMIADEESGKETSVSKIDGEELSEWVEIGFYDKDPKETLGDDWLKLERVKITRDKTDLSFTLPEKPEYILLDPRRLLIERNVKDNKKQLKIKAEKT